MPQMFPLPWLFLFLMFSILFMILYSKMFFSLKAMSPQGKQVIKKNIYMNWKW